MLEHSYKTDHSRQNYSITEVVAFVVFSLYASLLLCGHDDLLLWSTSTYLPKYFEYLHYFPRYILSIQFICYRCFPIGKHTIGMYLYWKHLEIFAIYFLKYHQIVFVRNKCFVYTSTCTLVPQTTPNLWISNISTPSAKFSERVRTNYRQVQITY